ncbi:MAG TPA: ATP-binding protein [Acidobacteriaceae bacterium]|nr:ATP-binding protein [Acidobacteriaceae bacterium]
MASRPPTPAKSKPGQEPLRFETRLRVYSLLLCTIIVVLLATLLLVLHLSASAIISILAVVSLTLLLAVVSFMDHVIRPLQTLANVVAALREEDYSFRARGARANDPFGDLAIEINALADAHQSQRLGSLEAAALFRRVIAELDAPVLAFDQSAHLRLINPAAERLFKINAARDLGRSADELHLDILLNHPPGEAIQIDNKLARAPSRWMIHASQFRQRGVPHTLYLLSDVSTALREEERVAWRRLIRVLGHEISNSLAPIKSIAGSLRARLPQDLNGALPDFDRGLDVIESRAESLDRFVQAYRQLAQLPAPSLRRIALRPLLERVARLEPRLDVTLAHIPGSEALPGQILADPDQLEQLFINLIRNAVEAAFSAREESIVKAVAAKQPPTPGHVALAPAVSIHVAPQGSFLSITVRDNGPGITNPGNLFVPFYTTKKAGSGVGLVLARQIAEAHGGTLNLRNRSDSQGCDAIVRLPLAQS